MRTWIFAPFLASTACALPVAEWTHDDVGLSQLELDTAQCTYQAEAATASYHSAPSDKSMTSAIGTGVGDGIVMAEKRIELTNSCMKAKGYRPAR